jgi:hypothetical protein
MLTRRCALLVGVLVAADVHAQTINTGPPMTPIGLSNGSVGYLGNQFSRGQSFTVGQTLTQLTSFSFYLANASGFGQGDFASMQFRAFLAKWNPSLNQAVGPALWQSNAVNGVASTAPTLVTFATPTISLTPGEIYIAILSDAGFKSTNAGINGFISYASSIGGPSGGAYIFTGTTDDPTLLTTGTWLASTGNGGHSLQVQDNYAFQATLSAATSVTPEPTSVALFASGLIGLVGLRRTRRRM